MLSNEILEFWNFDKNKIDPITLTPGSNKKVWWKCKKNHEWEASVNNINLGRKCPYCSNRKICKDNCLATTHPHLLKIWSNKNNTEPTTVTYGSRKKIWWKCSDCKEEWKCSIYHVSNGSRCPYCLKRKINKKNCLTTTHPELAKEWSNKNKLKPTEIASGSLSNYLWKCKKCNWEWLAAPNTRTRSGCPKCNESKGEKIVSQVLDKLQVRYKREYVFAELPRKRFDFALFKKHKKKPYAVIEYHGEQHYKIVNFSKNKKKNINKFERTLKNDKIKKDFILSFNLIYLEIPYYYDNKDLSQKINLII